MTPETAAQPLDAEHDEDPLGRILAAVDASHVLPLPAWEDAYDADARAQAVAMFRRLADAIESGALRGARVCWREGQPYIETVELDEVAREVRLRRHYTMEK